jgi:hypothetical protein
LLQTAFFNGYTLVDGVLHAAANTTYRLEFFDSPLRDGEGQNFLGFLNVVTDASGNVAFGDAFAGLATSLTATATDPADNTSMFSAPVAVS